MVTVFVDRGYYHVVKLVFLLGKYLILLVYISLEQFQFSTENT